MTAPLPTSEDLGVLSESVAPIVSYFRSHPLPHQGAPLLYLSLSELPRDRLPDVIESVTCAEDMFSEDRAKRDSERVNTHITQEQTHNADVLLGLVYLMVGGVDEAHDLVLPYSLPFDSEWGAPAVLDSPALGNATYAHGLVHRTEGRHVGELGMVGWENARSWFGETPQDHRLFSRFSKICSATVSNCELGPDDRELCEKVRGEKAWSWNSQMDLFTAGSQGLGVLCDRLHNLEVEMIFQHCNMIVNTIR